MHAEDGSYNFTTAILFSESPLRYVSQYRTVGGEFQSKKIIVMKCHVCGAKLESVVTDMPFKVTNKKIVIVEDLPIHQCSQCREFLLDDFVMERVETILEAVDTASKLEIVEYAA